MKYCLSSRNQRDYLSKADEIKVEYRDRKEIPDLFERYPEATIILQCFFYEEDLEWDNIKLWNNLSRGKFMLALSNIEDIAECKRLNVPFYYGFPVKTFYELNALKKLGVSYVRLDAPIFFEMDKVKSLGIPVRAVANVAYNDGLPREDGVCGVWIRPEDVETYEPYVSVIEFEDADPRNERALYRLYAEKKRWPGDLGMIITNFNHLGVNRLILPEVAEKRLNCAQKCQSGSACKIYYRAVDLADVEKLREYRDKMNEEMEEEDQL
jgi:hypothetical protein